MPTRNINETLKLFTMDRKGSMATKVFNFAPRLGQCRTIQIKF